MEQQQRDEVDRAKQDEIKLNSDTALSSKQLLWTLLELPNGKPP